MARKENLSALTKSLPAVEEFAQISIDDDAVNKRNFHVVNVDQKSIERATEWVKMGHSSRFRRPKMASFFSQMKADQ